MENKTEYRIISQKYFLADKFLQFKCEYGEWRFVPKEMSAYVLGVYLYQSDCPTTITDENYYNLQGCFNGHEDYYGGLISFTKKYPSIELYFEDIRTKRQDYLEREDKNKNNNEIIYL